VNLEALTAQRDELRHRWKEVRAERLRLDRQMGSGPNPGLKLDIKLLRKEQHRLSRMIVHIEKKINRLTGNERNKKQ
jgi:hypothetical protein